MQITKNDLGLGSDPPPPAGNSSRNADPTRDEAAKAGKEEVIAWFAARSEALSREKEYRKKAGDVVKIYEASEKSENSYNILYANTETLAPALYSLLPRPVVKRRFMQEDPIGVAVARLAQRSLEYLQDTDEEDYETFDSMMKASVLSALVPGRGVFRWKFDDKEVGGQLYKLVCPEFVRWDRVHFGYSHNWKDVPWVAFDHYMTRDEVETNFSKEIADKVQFAKNDDPGEQEEGAKSKKKSAFSDEGVGQAKLTLVIEVWDKAKREVKFYSQGYDAGPLKSAGDPFSLTGFFPIVRPLQMVAKVSTLIPTPLYVFYEEQAKELNRISQRINKIISHLRVRGIYDSRIGELEKVFTLNDGEMTPAESMESVDTAVKLENSLWFMPVDKLVAVLQQLYLQRAQVKEIIFELTGIADIMRGSSAASETLGAQEMKERWGGVRLKRMQREVARFACDNLRLACEMAFKLFDEQTFKAMTGLPFPLSQEKQQAQAMLAAVKQAAAMLPPGTPPPPEIMQKLQQAQQIASQPSYGELIAIGKSDSLRSYKIDIETNSTVDVEMTEDKKDIAEMFAAFTQAVQGIGPLVQEGAMPFDAAKAILKAISRRFRFGQEVEDLLGQMTQPKPPGQEEAALELKKMQAEHQLEVARFKDEQKQELTKLQLEMQSKRAELQMDQQEFKLKMQQMQAEHALKLKMLQEKQDADIAIAQQKAVVEAGIARDKAVREDQRAERDGQRERAASRKKEEQGDVANKALLQTVQALTKAVEKMTSSAHKAAGGSDKD